MRVIPSLSVLFRTLALFNYAEVTKVPRLSQTFHFTKETSLANVQSTVSPSSTCKKNSFYCLTPSSPYPETHFPVTKSSLAHPMNCLHFECCTEKNYLPPITLIFRRCSFRETSRSSLSHPDLPTSRTSRSSSRHSVRPLLSKFV